MLTASRIWIVLLVACAADVWAQTPDSAAVTNYVPPANEVRGTPFERFWTKSRIVPKLGVGAMDRAFVELGIQYHSIYRHRNCDQ